ncbi:hypothetical protein [uncultured Bacteroides sp.]|uniref:hypothetical protein n=1 Tax=uncultured Bacteroides sp. TaxID=162156 RepID=UPI0025FAD422|nr:hypothetical protein [uncultured Bacteroides sp.]
MKTKTLLGLFLLSVMTFCVSACQDDAEIILFSGSELINETGTCTNTISSTVLYLNGRETGDIGIANGKGGYSAQSSDETIVTATVSNDRLLLESHGKKGKVTVTVSDKKGNSVVLPVTVSYGIMTFYCGMNRSGFAISVDNEILTPGTDENKELLKSLNEIMLESYSFLEEQDICVLQPDNVSRFLEDGKGEFKLKGADGRVRAEGTYKVNRDEELGTGKPELAFSFYQHQNGADKLLHKFYFEPSFVRQPSTREVGPITYYWMEHVTDSHYWNGVSLPESGNVKVLYVVLASSSGIRSEL